MIRCIAVDDEPDALGLIRTFSEQIPFLKVEAYCSDSVEAFPIIQQVKPDLLLLDIEMPDVNGIELYNKLNKEIFVIFTTAYSKYAVEGFNLNAIDYLLKPFDFSRFLKAIERVDKMMRLQSMASQNENGDYIYVKSGYQNHKIILSDIFYIEAMDNHVRIHTPSKVYMPLLNMKGIMALLPSDRFVRIHRSYIVSVDKIKAFNRNHVTVGDRHIPLGKVYSSAFLEAIEELK